MKRNAKGFTLIELLIVVAIIGIIVAIAIPNLLNAIQRAKQRRTMGDIRTIATAIEAYAVDMNRYPPAAGSLRPPGRRLQADSDRRRRACTTTSPRPTSRPSPWPTAGTPGSSTPPTPTAPPTSLRSVGKDGSAPDYSAVGPTTDFNSDIVYTNGPFLQWPEGVQR